MSRMGVANRTISKTRSILRDRFTVSGLVGGRSFLHCSPQLSLSDACNYRCSMCWVHSVRAESSPNPHRSLFSESKPKILKYDDFVRIVSGLRESKVRQINLCGKGEPCLNPSFIDMCQYLGYRRIPFSLTTNASLLEPEISNCLVKTSITGISISLNAVDETAFQLINNPGKSVSLNRVVDNVNYLREKRNQIGSELKIQIGFVVSKMNIESARDMVRLGLLLGDTVLLMRAAIYEEIADMALDMADYERLERALSDFKNEERLTGVEDFLRKVRQAAGDHRYFLKDLFETRRCRIPFGFAVIHADGRVTPCCPTHYVCGNAIDTSFARIWNSEEFRQFRMQALALPERQKEASKSYCYCCDHH